MNVLAMNGSPHMENGNTAMIQNPFLEGMKESGADVDLFYIRRLNIEPCSGDMSCWFKHPGKCGKKDDMILIYPKLEEADVIVWASPVYYAGITGPLKNVMDRQLPLHLQSAEKGAKRKKMVLISTCASWEIGMFEPLLVQMRALSEISDGQLEFIGALLRPHAECMKGMLNSESSGLVEAVFQAAREAGRDVVRKGRISEETMDDVKRELLTLEMYNEAMEEWMQQSQASMKR